MSDEADKPNADHKPDTETKPVNVPDPAPAERHESADQPHREASNESDKGLSEVREAIASLTNVVNELATKISGSVPDPVDPPDHAPVSLPWTHRGKK